MQLALARCIFVLYLMGSLLLDRDSQTKGCPTARPHPLRVMSFQPGARGLRPTKFSLTPHVTYLLCLRVGPSWAAGGALTFVHFSSHVALTRYVIPLCVA